MTRSASVIALAGLALLCGSLCAQERRLALFEVPVLELGEHEQPGFDARLPLNAAYHPGHEFDLEWGGVSPEHVIDLVRDNVDPESWEEEGSFLEFSGRHLLVKNRRDVVERVGSFIAWLGEALSQRATVEVYRMDASHAGVRSAAETTELLESGKPALVARVQTHDARAARVVSGSKVGFVADYDVEIAVKSYVSDPIVAVVDDGLEVHVVATTAPGGARFVQVLLRESRVGKMRSVRTSAPGEGSLQAPDVSALVAQGSAVVARGGSFSLGADGNGGGAFYLVKVTGDEAPKAWDSRLSVVSSGGLAARPLDFGHLRVDGRRNDEDDEREEVEALMETDRLVEIAKYETDSEWDEHEGNRLDPLRNLLIVRSKPENVRKAERVIATIHERLVRNMTVELRAGRIGRNGVAALVSGEKEASELAEELQMTFVASAVANHPFRGVNGREHAYISDYDVEVAEASQAYDPVISTVFEGLAVAGHMIGLGQGGVALKADLLVQELTGAIEAFDVPAIPSGGGGRIDTPAARVTRTRIVETLKPGAWTAVTIADDLVVLARVR